MSTKIFPADEIPEIQRTTLTRQAGGRTRTVTVAWIPEVTDVDEMMSNAGQVRWVWADEPPVSLVTDPVTRAPELREGIVRVSADVAIAFQGHRVGSESELEQGSYFIEHDSDDD